MGRLWVEPSNADPKSSAPKSRDQELYDRRHRNDD
jgi:hypothetical protein